MSEGPSVTVGQCGVHLQVRLGPYPKQPVCAPTTLHNCTGNHLNQLKLVWRAFGYKRGVDRLSSMQVYSQPHRSKNDSPHYRNVIVLRPTCDGGSERLYLI